MGKSQFMDCITRAPEKPIAKAADPDISVKIAAGVLKIERVPGDGGCLFHSISKITGVPSDLLRVAVVIELFKQTDEWIESVLPEGDREAYCKHILQRDSWGGEVEIALLANRLRMQVRTYKAIIVYRRNVLIRAIAFRL